MTLKQSDSSHVRRFRTLSTLCSEIGQSRKCPKHGQKRPSLSECRQGLLSEFSFYPADSNGLLARQMTFIMAHFIWINMVLSPLKLCRREIFQNTLPTLGFEPIFPNRSGCQSPEKSPKSPTFSSCLLLLVFTKIQPRCPHFLVISKVELLDIILSFSSLVPGFHK